MTHPDDTHMLDDGTSYLHRTYRTTRRGGETVGSVQRQINHILHRFNRSQDVAALSAVVSPPRDGEVYLVTVRGRFPTEDVVAVLDFIDSIVDRREPAVGPETI